VWFARECERNFGGNPLAGGPKLQLFDMCKFYAKIPPKIFGFLENRRPISRFPLLIVPASHAGLALSVVPISNRRRLFSSISPSLCERFSIYPLGGVFCRWGTAKLVEQGASYSEGYIRYPHGFSGLIALRQCHPAACFLSFSSTIRTNTGNIP
jgi:hypothetical protein